ncbi:nucleoside triphosphate pyrophosphohydrolase [Clostridium sardiniense]|uniref:Nucleoside triphosphate pyrophosphohydrolase n=1 Tax=Clostridium sardiniense TaxID=29369 RepID=A0ABS7KZ14_CLOSR|nr:nucleoside triphosphate pyrophosphohydrolase [Clostridium sardiniense]MBY0756054.1 nucleoside triphosphate pyrophosphohydrolase [Clostridium sardiniense]MDQ0460656.1 tetrapyrrole methylase family protein/MazG family protein [Clostridium sardiniense]
MIKIIGLGPGASDALTVGALRVLEESDNIYFRTEIHPTVEFIRKRNIEFKTYDHFYNSGESFDEVYKNIAEDLVEIHKATGNVVYAVPGHPLVAEKSVSNLMEICDEEEIEYDILPAVSFIDAMMDRLKIDPIEGLKVIDAFDINNQIMDKRIGTIITQVYNPFIASEVKLKLLECYDDETKIIYVRAAGIEGLESIREIPLYELDMQEDIDYLTSVYIPKDLNNKKDINDLIALIDILRSDEGCPWDREQTHESIKNGIVEESYEVKDAIEKDDDNALIEELGDVLLHVIFHSSIGKEDGYFDFSDVIEGIYTKMIDRHPHIFKGKDICNSEEVVQNWDEIKKEEKGFETVTEELRGVANALPALIRAHKIQNKARKVGFDWDNVEDASKKVTEELNEVLDVYNTEDKGKITEEVGDLLFACVNVARFLNVDEEEALNKTTDKFIRRFSFIEEQAISKGKNLRDMSLEEMDELWNEAKKQENN